MKTRTRLEEAGSQDKHSQKLMVTGSLLFDHPISELVEVARGMVIRSNEGKDVGKVAALVFDSAQRGATHLLLSRLPESGGYWQIPVEAVAAVRDNEVWLSISSQAVDDLPHWHS